MLNKIYNSIFEYDTSSETGLLIVTVISNLSLLWLPFMEWETYLKSIFYFYWIILFLYSVKIEDKTLTSLMFLSPIVGLFMLFFGYFTITYKLMNIIVFSYGTYKLFNIKKVFNKIIDDINKIKKLKNDIKELKDIKDELDYNIDILKEDELETQYEQIESGYIEISYKKEPSDIVDYETNELIDLEEEFEWECFKCGKLIIQTDKPEDKTDCDFGGYHSYGK